MTIKSKSSFRAVAQALTAGVPNNVFKGFQTLEEAKEYMGRKGLTTYYTTERSHGPTEMSSQKSHYYAVANGRERGIYRCY